MFVDPLGLEPGDEKINAFGTMLTEPALAMAQHYYDQAIELTQSYIDDGQVFDEKYATDMKAINDLIDEVIALDQEGKISGNIYNVPLYKQGKYKLCWAFSQVMIEDWKSDTNKTGIQVIKRAISIAKSVYGSGKEVSGEYVWNQGGWPTNSLDVTIGIDGTQNANIQKVNSFAELIVLTQNNPVYAFYSNNAISKAHLIVITGVVSVPTQGDFVFTNNPWGNTDVQRFSDFTTGIRGDKTGMSFGGVLRL